MNPKKLIPIICMVSLLVYFIWGYAAGSFKHSWLVFIAAGIGVVAISAFSKNDKDNDGK